MFRREGNYVYSNAGDYSACSWQVCHTSIVMVKLNNHLCFFAVKENGVKFII